MKKFSKIALSSAAAALSCTVMGIIPSIAAEGPGAAKLDLLGPAANIFCVGLEPFPGEDASITAPGFVIFNATGSGQVHATVSVKGWEPNTDYLVRLIQSDGSDCFTYDGTIRTNGKGNGTTHIQEQVTGDAVQVFIDTRAPFSPPNYRATEAYRFN